MTVSCVSQPHPASAAAAAVLVAHASSLGPGGNANTKYNADGSTSTGGLNDMEQGMGQGPLGQNRDVINIAPLVSQQTHGPVSYNSLYMPMCQRLMHGHGTLWCACTCRRACLHACLYRRPGGSSYRSVKGFSCSFQVVNRHHCLACTHQKNHPQPKHC